MGDDISDVNKWAQDNTLTDDWLLSLFNVLPDKLEHLRLIIDRQSNYTNAKKKLPIFTNLLRVSDLTFQDTTSINCLHRNSRT